MVPGHRDLREVRPDESLVRPRGVAHLELDLPAEIRRQRQAHVAAGVSDGDAALDLAREDGHPDVPAARLRLDASLDRWQDDVPAARPRVGRASDRIDTDVA